MGNRINFEDFEKVDIRVGKIIAVEDSANRRKGISSQFLKHFESICQTCKLFTSTNKSNKSMQKSLEKAGFTISGHIDNLDENDPEIVYFKQVTQIPLYF